MMSSILTRAAVATGLLASTVSAAFSATSTQNVVVYWGQGENNIPLSKVCSDPNVDIVSIGFITGFPKAKGQLPVSNFGNACYASYYPNPDGSNSGLLSECPTIEPGIDLCHQNGKKVLLSLGGGWPKDYQLPSADVAKDFAEFLWGAFGPATTAWKNAGKPRPFGNAFVDGFDLDIESNASWSYYDVLANHFKKVLFPQQAGKFYLTAAPQCQVPDVRLSPAIKAAEFDFIFVQFYNTPECNARVGYQGVGKATTAFTFDKWITELKTGASKNARVYIGLPAGVAGAPNDTAAFLSPTEANTLIRSYQSKYPSNFGGVMLWEATVSDRYPVKGATYVAWMKQICTGKFTNENNPPKPASSTIISSTKTSSSLSSSKTSTISLTSTKTSSSVSSTKTSSSLSSTKTSSSLSSTKTSSSSSSTKASSSSSSSVYSATSLSSTKASSSSSSSVYSATSLSSTKAPSSSSSTKVSSSSSSDIYSVTSLSSTKTSSPSPSSTKVSSSSSTDVYSVTSLSSSSSSSTQTSSSPSATQTSSSLSSTKVSSSSSSSSDVYSATTLSSSSSSSSAVTTSSSSSTDVYSATTLSSSSSSSAAASSSSSTDVYSATTLSSSSSSSSAVTSSSSSSSAGNTESSSSSSAAPTDSSSSSSASTTGASSSSSVAPTESSSSSSASSTGSSSSSSAESSSSASSTPSPTGTDSTSTPIPTSTGGDHETTTPCTTSTGGNGSLTSSSSKDYDVSSTQSAPSNTAVSSSSSQGTSVDTVSTPCTTSGKSSPTSSSSQKYPEQPASSSSREYPVETPANSGKDYPTVTPKPTPSATYPVDDKSVTVITTTYVDSCSTGLTTITTTVTKTVCNKCAKPTDKPEDVPEGWTTSVYVCTKCGPATTTVTLTKPVEPTEYPVHGQAVPSDVPETPKGEEEEEEVTSVVEQYVTLTKVAIPYTPAPQAPANNTGAYKPTSTGGAYPTKYTPPEFEGAASRAGVGLSAMVVLIAGVLAL